MRITRETIFDFKEIGLHAAIIFLGPLIYLAVFAAVAMGAHSDMREVMVNIFEIVIPMIGGYGAVMLMQSLLDTDGGEILFTYRHSSAYWGIIRQLRLYIVYQLLGIVVIFVMAAISGPDFWRMFLINAVQCFAVMGVAFFGVAVTRKVAIGLVILVAFIGIQITLGQEFPIFNLIYVFSGANCGQPEMSNVIFNSIVIGLFGYSMGQTWIKPK